MIPPTRLEEVYGTLAFGEIQLMLGLPKRCISARNELVLKHHLEAGLGGVGWTAGAFKKSLI